MTAGSIAKERLFPNRIEENIKSWYRYISDQFETESSFNIYVQKERRCKVRDKGWDTAVTISAFGENMNGAPRSILELFKNIVKS